MELIHHSNDRKKQNGVSSKVIVVGRVHFILAFIEQEVGNESRNCPSNTNNTIIESK